MFRLNCQHQSYDWGKLGLDSAVGQLQSKAGQQIDASSPYAELWMGTHPNGPSRLADREEEVLLLSDFLSQTDQPPLPFLFKVLSVNKALSIQAHPDQSLAATLHADAPHIYKDANHKPEMAIAITQFEALCQFRSFEDIQTNIQTTPELLALFPSPVVDEFLSSTDKTTALRTLFTSLIHSEKQNVQTQFTALTRRLGASPSLSPLDALVLRLSKQYPMDIGVFAPYILNYIILQPGEAVFLGANEPHAYLSGDCIECMACSDNVVRAGLTPKFIDKDTLCNMLTYRFGKPTIQNGVQVDEYCWLYTPPVMEFEVEYISLPAKLSYCLKSCESSSIILIFNGSCAAHCGKNENSCTIQAGSVFYVAPSTQLNLTAYDKGVQIYRAHSNHSI